MSPESIDVLLLIAAISREPRVVPSQVSMRLFDVERVVEDVRKSPKQGLRSVVQSEMDTGDGSRGFCNAGES
jgi:hypothetical protein